MPGLDNIGIVDNIGVFNVVFFRYIVIVSVLNEISFIFDTFAYLFYLFQSLLYLISSLVTSIVHIHIRTKRSNASSTIHYTAYTSCTGESTNGGPVACKKFEK